MQEISRNYSNLLIEEGVADLKEKYAKEKTDSDSVTSNSKDELVEGKILGAEYDILNQLRKIQQIKMTELYQM